MTKTEITQKLNALEQYGFLVATFNSNKYTGTGFKGFPDHEVIGAHASYYIEVKLGHDTMKPRQLQYQELLRGHSLNKYYICTGDDINDIINDIVESENRISER